MSQTQSDHMSQEPSLTNRGGVSLICVYNNRQLYKEMCGSASRNLETVEIIGLDNTCSTYTCAAAALNEGIRLAHSDILVFVHQDIEFLDASFFDMTRELLSERDAIVGVAGVTQNRNKAHIISTIWEGSSKELHHATMMENACAAFTLDECCFALRRDLLDSLYFDSDTCDGWHFYAVDLCLQAELLGIPRYVIKSNVWHKSHGSIDRAFLRCEARIARKYRGKLAQITTTCTWIPTGVFGYSAVRSWRWLKPRLTALVRHT